MPKHDDLAKGDALPEYWLDQIQEVLAALAIGLKLEKASANSVRIVAGTNNDQVCVVIEGRWRYNTSTVTAAHPGGLSGTYDVWVTASLNNFTGIAPNIDLTDYSFGLTIKPTSYIFGGGDPPLRRKIGTVDWSGAEITKVNQTVGDLVGSGAATGLVAQLVGNNVLTDFDLIHGLNTRNLVVSVRETASPWAFVHPEIQALDDNQVRVRFSIPPATGQYMVIVAGGSDVASITVSPHGLSHHPLSGSDKVTMSLFGTLAGRPAATTVAVGTIYRSTDTGLAHQSDGSAWSLITVTQQPRVKLRKTLAQSIPDNVMTVISFGSSDTEDYDADAMHSPTVNPSRITVVAAGAYALIAQFATANPSENGNWQVQIRKNAATIIAHSGSPTFGVSVAVDDEAIVGDFYEMLGYQAHTPSPGALITSNLTFFSAKRFST